MLRELKTEANRTMTENGAVTLRTTGSDCLDLFATIGALRRQSDDEIITRFTRAFSEDRDLALKTLFFARDIRGGLGERRVFRVVLKWLAENEKETVKKNLRHVAEFGRYDDLLALMDTACEKDMLDLIRKQFALDLEAMRADRPLSLLAKWLPSVNASSRETVRCARRIAKALGMTEETYRKALSAMRERISILENYLRRKDYTFDYEKQPSRAMLKYRQAFYRSDEERYRAYLSAVAAGEKTMHTDNIAPYELIAPYLNGNWRACFLRDLTQDEKETLNTFWSALPDYGTDHNTLAVIDTSGSMYCGSMIPGAVALSLGLYFAEHNTGEFRNHFIEFSRTPRLIELKGETFCDRLRYAASFNEVANTNLEAVFDLILETAVRHAVPQEELPEKLVIISDMEFDQCVDNAELSNLENAKRKYARHGYRLPGIVFWNVDSRNTQQPVRMNEEGVTLVSGVTPRLFEMVMSGTASPYGFMLEILGSKRYAGIAA